MIFRILKMTSANNDVNVAEIGNWIHFWNDAVLWQRLALGKFYHTRTHTILYTLRIMFVWQTPGFDVMEFVAEYIMSSILNIKWNWWELYAFIEGVIKKSCWMTAPFDAFLFACSKSYFKIAKIRITLNCGKWIRVFRFISVSISSTVAAKCNHIFIYIHQNAKLLFCFFFLPLQDKM